MFFMRKLSLLLLVLASVPACRDSSGDDAATPDSSVNTEDVTVQQVRDPAMPNGTAVKMKGVVVTAVDKFGDKQGRDFWVQEPGGGQHSGIQVHDASLETLASLAVGDVVDISGAVKDEFHYNGNMGSGGFPEGYSITQLSPPMGGALNVTTTGAKMTITPDEVDALPIGQLPDYMARHAEWEKWEGVVVTLKNVSATSSDECVGSQCPDMTNRKFDVTGDIAVQSSLAAMPTTAVLRGDCLASVTGVVTYFFDYQILPRTTNEIATGGASCPVENSAAACGDGVDNDGNGFKDCDDLACSSVAACTTTASIEQVRTGQATGNVTLEDVYVSAVSFNKKNFWISQSLTAAGNQGVYVFRCSGSSCTNTPVLDAAVVAGAKVKVTGKVTDFNNNDPANGAIMQITNPTITVVAAPTTQVVPVTGQSVSSLLAAGTGEAYEGVLVTLTNVKVTTVGTSGNFNVSDLAQFPGTGSVAFKADDDIYRFVTGDMNACYASITGIWTYTPFDKRYQFLPTAVGTGTGVCTP
jgi:hypothetical protein